MGSLVGGVIGGIGSMIGAGQQASAADQAAQASRLGYDWLTTGGGSGLSNASVSTGTNALNNMGQLLGVQPLADGTSSAFNQYKDSTGYNFQLQSGQNALTSSAAAKGLLRSGATAKALEEYGQNLGTQTFNNYLTQLSGLAQAGQNTAAQVGGVGSAAGQGMADAYINKGNALAGGTSGLFQGLGTGIGSLI